MRSVVGTALAGGIHRLTDIAQVIAKLFEFSPFGRMLQETGSAPNEFVFPGTYIKLAGHPGLRLSPCRAHDATTGSFVLRDRWRTADGHGPLDTSIAVENWLSATDPTGLRPPREKSLEYARRLLRAVVREMGVNLALTAVPYDETVGETVVPTGQSYKCCVPGFLVACRCRRVVRRTTYLEGWLFELVEVEGVKPYLVVPGGKRRRQKYFANRPQDFHTEEVEDVEIEGPPQESHYTG